MIVVCPTCSSAWELPAERAATGARVRCATCREAWYAPPDPGRTDDPAEENVIDAAASSARAEPMPLFEPPRRSRRPVEAPARRRRPGLRRAAAILIAAAAPMLLVGKRESVVAALPGTARAFAAIGLPVNLAGLELRNVSSQIAEDGGQRVLAVVGEVANVSTRPVSPPPLAVSLRGADGRAIYVWTAEAPKAKLAPGESVAFRTRLAAPPDRAREVVVSLAEAARAPAAGESRPRTSK